MKVKSTIVHRLDAYPLQHQPYKVDCDVQQMLRCSCLNFTWSPRSICYAYVLRYWERICPAFGSACVDGFPAFIRFHYDICSSSTTQSFHLSLEFTVWCLFLEISPLEWISWIKSFNAVCDNSIFSAMLQGGAIEGILVDDALDYVFLLEDLSECHGGYSIPSGIVSIPLIPTGFEGIVAVRKSVSLCKSLRGRGRRLVDGK